MPKRPESGLWEHHPHLCLPLARRLLAERERRQPAAPAPAQTPENGPPEQAGEEAMQHDANHPDRRGLGKQRRAALAKRKEAAANAAGGPAKGPQQPVQERHIGRLFGLLPCKHGLEAVHITGTLTTLGDLLRRHEKYHPGGVEKLTGLQLPKSDDWRMFTVPEVLKILDLERVCATEGSKLTAKKRRAVEACLQSKREEFEVDVDEDGQLRKGRKVVKAEKTESKKTEWFVHIGWAFFALLFNFRRFEGCGWYSAGHWRTNGYSVTVTLRRARGPPRPGDPPPRPPDPPKTSGKRTRGGAPLGAPQGRGIADEYYRRDPPPEDAKVHMYVGIDPGRTKMYTAVDEHANVTSCSSKEFHAMSGAKRREGVIAKWHADAPPLVKKLHQCPTYKTASTAVLLSRVVKIVPDLRRGLAWHRDGKPFRKLWHQAYVGRERAITRLAEQFRAPPGMTTVVGVGNWSAQDRGGIMRGTPPGPWIRFLRRLRRYVRVRNGEEKLMDVWDTKRCTNKACKVHVVNRDVNGAANILMLTKGNQLRQPDLRK
ncbi:hypothetical protein APUTEX25_003183 [Auxenochlorella protothecoides]|uniref:Uncharacterized protein n=1 Tax=Auxenochlorella protothecoides TaxID=3075 RepID=A0A3M7KUW5_AUXPR|nr:hypothetical protein APUTEX25_003183 [Auxenochlorella protothecoides]|eukprot:RMZ53649.1 hypothetical protein APUTEX25_003183 [Auxenochlorella protothecoides]